MTDIPVTTPMRDGSGRGAWITSILIAALPLSLAIEPHAKVVVPAALFLMGVTALIRRHATRASLRAVWPPFAAAAAFVLVAMLNVAWHGLGGRPLDQPGHVILYMVIAAAFTLELRPAAIWAGFSATGALLGGVCLWQRHLLGIARPYGLSGGTSAAIELAVILIALSLMALAQALNTASDRRLRLFHGLCSMLALYGAVLTASRGPLLALPPAWLVIGLPHLRQARMSRRHLLALGAAALVALATLAAMSGPLVRRFDAVRPALEAFRQGEHLPGPVGERLEMWRVAWRGFRTHPLQGIGLHRFHPLIQDEIAAGRAPAFIAKYNQPHNAYLYATVSGGIGMLAALLWVLLAPLPGFLRRLRAEDAHIAATARAGAAVVILYLVSGLTAGVFYRIMPLSLFFFVTLGCSVLIASQQQRSTALATD